MNHAEKKTSGGTDTVAARIDPWTPTVTTLLNEIARRALRAQVFVVGYGKYLRTGRCHLRQLSLKQNATYMQAAINHLNTTLRQAAEHEGAAFVDTCRPGIGHDICAAPDDRCIEGLIPSRPAAPLHPNAA
ncbi:hypothetical protein [Streptomyces sp. NPDC047841]|uniref:hypothetical protein n=1 Tax=Streptomyces sp. NPDC047841 TaxID=3154708 RepID=UPI003454AFBA